MFRLVWMNPVSREEKPPFRAVVCRSERGQDVAAAFDDACNMTLLLGAQSCILAWKNLSSAGGIALEQITVHCSEQFRKLLRDFFVFLGHK